MKSASHGRNTSKAEITNISPHGFWILLSAKEYFLPFDRFPWFKNASVAEIVNFEVLHGTHLHWTKLDVDLSLKILDEPWKYPLVAK